jgi:hypothetical protein
MPALTMSPAEIAALNCVPLTNVVTRLFPPHRTTEPLTKLVPLTVSVNAELPATTEFGLILVIVAAIPGLEILPRVPPVESTTYRHRRRKKMIRNPGNSSKPGIAVSLASAL